jgi:hypothetical protein
MGDGGNEPGSTCLGEKHGGESGETCPRKRCADGAGRAGEGGERGARGLRTGHATWVVSLERGTRKRNTYNPVDAAGPAGATPDGMA